MRGQLGLELLLAFKDEKPRLTRILEALLDAHAFDLFGRGAPTAFNPFEFDLDALTASNKSEGDESTNVFAATALGISVDEKNTIASESPKEPDESSLSTGQLDAKQHEEQRSEPNGMPALSTTFLHHEVTK